MESFFWVRINVRFNTDFFLVSEWIWVDDILCDVIMEIEFKRSSRSDLRLLGMSFTIESHDEILTLYERVNLWYGEISKYDEFDMNCY